MSGFKFFISLVAASSNFSGWNNDNLLANENFLTGFIFTSFSLLDFLSGCVKTATILYLFSIKASSIFSENAEVPIKIIRSSIGFLFIKNNYIIIKLIRVIRIAIVAILSQLLCFFNLTSVG